MFNGVIKMRKMKNSGIEWVGDIPDNWGVEKTKFNFKYKKEIVGIKCNELERLALTMKNVVKRPKDDNTGLQPEKFETYQILRKNELVFKLIDLQNVSTSRVGLSPYVGLVSPAYIILRASGKVLPQYAEKYFYTLWKNQIFNSLGDDGVRSNLGKDDLLNILMPVPPIEEQRKIAEFLDEKCGEIDALIADIKAQIESLEQYKRSVITEAVTKGLNHSVEMKDSGIKWVGKMPLHWDIKPNKYLMKKVKDISVTYNGENILSLTMNGVIVRDLEAGGKMPTSFDGYQIIKTGNLLMCLFDIDVTPRCVGLIKNNGVTSPAYSQYKMRKGALASYYNYYYLMVDFTKELLHMAKNLRHSLNEEQFGAIKAPVPPIEEQKQIADYLDNKCAQIEELKTAKQSQIETLEAYKKSIIYEYVTGKKEVLCVKY